MRNLTVVSSSASPAIATISTTELLIATIKTGNVVVGSTWQFDIYPRHTNNTTTSTFTLNMRYGSTGTTADTSLGTVVSTTIGPTSGFGHGHIEGHIWIVSSSSIGFAVDCEIYGVASTGNSSTGTGLTLAAANFLTLTGLSSSATGTWSAMKYVMQQIC